MATAILSDGNAFARQESSDERQETIALSARSKFGGKCESQSYCLDTRTTNEAFGESLHLAYAGGGRCLFKKGGSATSSARGPGSRSRSKRRADLHRACRRYAGLGGRRNPRPRGRLPCGSFLHRGFIRQ